MKNNTQNREKRATEVMSQYFLEREVELKVQVSQVPSAEAVWENYEDQDCEEAA